MGERGGEPAMASEGASLMDREAVPEGEEDGASCPRLKLLRRSLRSWASLLLVGTGAALCAGAYALVPRIAAGGLHGGRHSNSSAFVGLQNMLLPDFGDDDSAFRVAGEPLVKREFSKSRCIANVLSGSFQIADVAITSIQANQDCPLAASGSAGTTSGTALASAKSALLDVERLVKEAQESLEKDTSKLPALMKLREAMKAKAEVDPMAEAAKKVDEAQIQLDAVKVPDPDVDLYSTKRLAEMKCARDALIIARSVGAAAAKLSVAAGNCPEEKNKPPGTQCATQVSGAISVVSLVGAEIDRMVINCRPGFYDLFLCTSRLEGLSWNIAAAAKFLSGAVRACRADEEKEIGAGSKAVNKMHFKDTNYAWCIGEIFSTMGYIGTTGMWIYNGAHYDCEQVHRLIDLMSNRTLTPLEMESLKIFRARCAADYASSIRTVFLAFVKGFRSAGHCGDLDETCPRDILRSASAFAGVAEAGSRIYARCYVVPEYRGVEPANLTEIRTPLCVQETGSMVKMLGIAASFLTDATGSCVDTHFARTRCGASILRALAALGAFVEIYSNMHLNCNVRQFWFLCGRDMRFSGETIRVFTLAVATAALNCGLSPFTDQWKATSPVAMPRFFTFP